MADRRGGYVLGVDLGTTFTAAAVARGASIEICVLGTRAAQIPSVVVHRADGEVLTGEAADRRAADEPTRAAREFKRRFGDPIPIIVGGVPFGSEAITAELLSAIIGLVTQRQGGAPDRIVLTHPANWGEYKLDLLRHAAQLAGVEAGRLHLVSEPVAAAIAYDAQQRIEPGEVIAIYDLGGGTFDAAVVRSTAGGFELLGTPEGMERLGGIDFDQAILAHVDRVVDGMVSSADRSDPMVIAAQARLREDCRRAKEALSTDSDATIQVVLPGTHTAVRLTRPELESMMRPRIDETVAVLRRTIASAGLRPEQVSRALLVGGSSRMPLVADIVRHQIGVPVSLDADPKLSTAIGAALSVGSRTTPPPPPPPPASPSSLSPSSSPSPPSELGAHPASSATAGVLSAPLPGAPSRSTRRPVVVVAGVALIAALAAGVVVATRSDEKDGAGATTTAATTEAATTTPAATTPATTTVSEDATGTTGTTPAQSGGVERFAFDGTQGHPSVSGPAMETGTAARITGFAVAADGELVIISEQPAVVSVADGEVVVRAELEPEQSPPGGVTIGSDGAVFVATPKGVVEITDGSSTLLLDSSAAGLTPLLGPVALDGGGNLYVADNGSGRILRRAPDGRLTLVAGTGVPATADSVVVEAAPAATTQVGTVTAMVVDADGRLVIADATLQRVRAIAPDGSMSTVAGGGPIGLDALEAGTSGTDLNFGSVDSVAVDAARRVYVVDGAGGAIVRIAGDAPPEVLLGNPEVSPVIVAPADSPGLREGASVVFSQALGILYSDGLAVWRISIE